MISDLQRFNCFLGGVNLGLYRKKYAPIKLVELDLPKNIQAISRLYRDYWDNREEFPDYPEFYKTYSSELKDELEKFRRDKMFSDETFYRGLPARIYRTWASLLTQIQGGYVAESIYGEGNVAMNSELDYSGIDMRINDGGDIMNIQIKKETMSREVRAPWQLTKRHVRIIAVSYEVVSAAPKTPTGKISVPYQRWAKKWAGKLERLPNGFIIFLPGMFEREYISVP